MTNLIGETELTERQVQLIKQGYGVMENAGEEFLTKFYDTMLHENPSLLNLFNRTNQRTLAQPRALAHAVVMYAKNIDNLEKFEAILKRVSQKHVSLNIQPDMYPVLGKYLLRSMKLSLGPRIATPEFMQAWSVAFNKLAMMFIKYEAAIYRENAETEGGWSGYRAFVVVDKIHETRNVISLRLKPRDGKKVIVAQPGQCLGVRFRLPGHIDCRQYSISEMVTTGTDGYQISAKRLEKGEVSTYIHDNLRLGDVVDVSAPSGFFGLKDLDPANRKVLFLGAGIGVTPLISMSKQALDCGADVSLVQCEYNKKTLAFEEHFEDLAELYNNFDYEKYYSSTGVRFGKRDLDRILRHGPTDVYVSGPVSFMQDIRKYMSTAKGDHRAHFAFFGPTMWED